MDLAVLRSSVREAAEEARRRGHELPRDETLDQGDAARVHVPENGEVESVRPLGLGRCGAIEGGSS
jgi:hypothetical protein